jgi:hypothetical protein
MKGGLILQLHVHSNRSHDSDTPIKKYVRYLNKIIKKNEIAILGITDHNVLPITTEKAMELSEKNVLVIPGIQWKLHKSFWEAWSKLCTRREILTLGDHDNLQEYIAKKTNYSILKNKEINGNFTEKEFLNYLSKNKKRLILIFPHPKHFGVDYYGDDEIKKLVKKIRKRKIFLSFFVEEYTGYDPFPRIFHHYKGEFPVLADSDAHEIKSFIGTNSLFSAYSYIDCDEKFKKLIQKIIKRKDKKLYKKIIKKIFRLLKTKNSKIKLIKNYFASTIQFLESVPRFIKRRFENFPHNLTK